MHILKTAALLLLLAFCRPALAQPADMTKQAVDYINLYKDIAVSEMLRAKIPASITLAQGLLESNYGNSRLAKEAHNHFGIKCKSNWTGKVILEDDDDFQECFRWYDTPYDSYKDHSDFLTSSPRYAFLFQYEITDYKSWAYGLKQAGYATNPTYAPQLITLIEKYQLKQYDVYIQTPDGVRDTARHDVMESNGIPSTKAKQYDSYTRIAMEKKMKVGELLKFNDLSQVQELKAGDVVYLKPKKDENKAFQTHVMRSGESMHDVSQLYGIKLDILLQRNGLKPGEEPSQGEKITLNKKNKKKIKKRRDSKPGTHQVDMNVSMGERTRADSIMEARYNTQAALESKLDTSLTGTSATAAAAEKPYTGNHDTEVAGDDDEKPDEVTNNELFHYVTKGETMYSISKKYKITVEELKLWNGLKTTGLRIGRRLQVSNHNLAIVSPEKTFVMDADGYYTVQDDDNLKSIATHFSLTKAELAAINKFDTISDTLFVGQKLFVVKSDSEPVDRPSFYVVKPGDTLLSISRKYDIKIEDLRRLNSLKNDDVQVGKKLFLQ